MPGNTVVINGSLEWYVGDSRMDELIKWLNSFGFKHSSSYDEREE